MSQMQMGRRAFLIAMARRNGDRRPAEHGNRDWRRRDYCQEPNRQRCRGRIGKGNQETVGTTSDNHLGRTAISRSRRLATAGIVLLLERNLHGTDAQMRIRAGYPGDNLGQEKYGDEDPGHAVAHQARNRHTAFHGGYNQRLGVKDQEQTAQLAQGYRCA